MKHIVKFLAVIILVIISSSFKSISPVATFAISIKLTDIRNSKGIMQLQLYRSQKTFAAETPYKTYRISKTNVSDKTLHYTIKGLSPGNYGVALLDDENGNKKMDYGWIYPNEGFGFSNYYHTGWSKPSFYEFKFYLNKEKAVNMKVRYM